MSLWIKTKKGALINLDTVSSIRKEGKKIFYYDVGGQLPGGYEEFTDEADANARFSKIESRIVGG